MKAADKIAQTKELDAKILKALSENSTGMTYEQIGELFGVGRRRVQDCITRHPEAKRNPQQRRALARQAAEKSTRAKGSRLGRMGQPQATVSDIPITTRAAAEFFLLGTIGKPKLQSRSIRNLIVAPIREHSRKPDDLHEMAEAMYNGPYLELFARQERPGWTVWGNEVGKFGD